MKKAKTCICDYCDKEVKEAETITLTNGKKMCEPCEETAFEHLQTEYL